ncbi:ATP-binding cassette permease mdl1 [Orbilia brochopaga]|uniref:ATP-binding cassette permease mdl1 n=1 Tax=Orbilia brochopaga TaxID=3140254 RepID=A0AAV9UIP0_9PEZI
MLPAAPRHLAGRILHASKSPLFVSQCLFKPTFSALAQAAPGPSQSARLAGSIGASARSFSTRGSNLSATPRHGGGSQLLRFIASSRRPALIARHVRQFSASPLRRDDSSKEVTHEKEHHLHDSKTEFGRSEKASKAAQVNLSARLRKDPGTTGFSGFADIWRLLKIARPEAKWLGAAFLCLLVSSAISMSIPFSIGKILDAATASGEEGTLFGLPMNQFYMALAGVLCVGAMANYGRIILLRVVGERIVSRLRTLLYRRTYTQDAEFFDANRVGDLISKLSSDTIIVAKSITQNISDGLRALVSGAAGLVMMLYTSAALTGVMSLMIPPIGIGAFFYGRTIRNISRKIQKAIGDATKVAEERLGNVRTSQAFAGEAQEVGRYNKQVRKIFKLGVKEALASATFFSTTGFAGNITILAILVFGSQQVKSGAISIGELTSFLMYTAYAGSSLFGLSSFYSELMKGVGAASRLFELQDREPSHSLTKGKKIESAKGTITFEDVVFSYPTRPAVTIFEGLNFSIPPGSNVSIVGPSGGGKSTVSSLLLRFYSPNSGRILINGMDLEELNIKSLRRKIGVVSQEPVLFSGTISENIAYGKPNATREEIVQAARRANCQFISDFPDGLETYVGPRGTQLSGGQRQRIAIARAIVKEPDIIILDEATSALDAESETLVNEALQKLMQGSTTTISIAHRLSTIKRSERIIVLGADGRVAEEGTYAELTGRDGAFSKLMESQLGGGPEEEREVVMARREMDITEREADEAERIREEEERIREEEEERERREREGEESARNAEESDDEAEVVRERVKEEEKR